MTAPAHGRSDSVQGTRIDERLRHAIALHHDGQLAQAEVLYREVLKQVPTHFDALHLLGAIQHQRGRHESAVELIERAILVNAGEPAAHSNLGLALQGLRRHKEALASYDRALALNPEFPEALNNRGNALQKLNRLEEALASYDRALALNPEFPEALNNRGNALQKLGRLDEALAAYDRALAFRPDYAEALNNRADTLLKLQRPSEALESCERALELMPDFPAAHNSRGNALQDLNLPEEALASYERALALEPDYVEALSNRGNALQDLNRSKEALASFRRALALDPGYAAAHWNESLCRLVDGDFEQGWKCYEWRWQAVQQGSKRDFRQPLWRGEQSITGRTILLHAEQGLGDTIQFCRYANLVAQRGATVLLEVQRPLVPLLSGLKGVDRLFARGDSLPPFEYHCPLLSLPLAFETRLATIPAAVPYLRSDPHRVAEWRAKLGERQLPRIGLAWSGRPSLRNDYNRSIPLTVFAGLLSSRAQFVSLQKELRPADRAAMEAHGDILHFGDALNDFGDTAGLVELMDLVISVDSSVAHLAGAMGKPVWILLPFAPDWRWLLDRDDSPWYPTARLFRQHAIGDWPGVIERVAREMAASVAPKGGGLARVGRAMAAWIRKPASR